MTEPIVIPAKDGWVPSAELISRVRAEAKRLGLICDWPRIAVLENHDLLLSCTHITGEFGTDLVAIKRGNKYIFKTDREACEYDDD